MCAETKISCREKNIPSSSSSVPFDRAKVEIHRRYIHLGESRIVRLRCLPRCRHSNSTSNARLAKQSAHLVTFRLFPGFPLGFDYLYCMINDFV